MFDDFSDLAGAQHWALIVLAGSACLAVCAAAFRVLRRGQTAASEPADSEQILRERNARLDAALNNMTQGLCMFDASERIVVLNRRFLEMYKLSPQVVRPGCTFMELLRHRREVGLLETDPEKFYADLKRDLATGRSTHLTHKTRDSRFILAHNQPMPGGGWVTTHEDITEQRNAEKEIREQKLNRPMPDGRWVSTHDDITVQQNSEKALRDQKMQLDVALNNMSQGLCMFDGQARLILCNQRYLQMSGISESDIRPGITLVELLEKRRAKGTWSRDPQEYVDELRATLAKGETFTVAVESPGGRVVSIYNRPLPDGQWVSCHEDITERQNVEKQIGDQKLQLDAALNNMSQGLCMFSAEGRIILFNQRYVEQMGSPPEFLMGRPFLELLKHREANGDFVGDPDKFYAATIQAVREGRSKTRIVERKDGRTLRVVDQPMANGGWLATFEDITEQRRAEERLREQKLRLDAALNNMSQGLCMFDAHGRIVLFNARYAEIVGFAPELLQGLSFAELLTHRKTKGDFVGDPETFSALVLASVREGKTTTKIAQVRSGHIHRIVVQPMPTGGWVSTLEDITEQRRAEEQLNEQRVQLDTALNNMSQGLNMFDAAGRLVVCNERYMQIYGLSPDDVKPGATMQDLVQVRMAKGTFFAIDPEAYIAELMDSMQKREPTQTELELPDQRTISVFSQPTPDGNGWVVTHEDITERRRAEQERDRSHLFATTVIENVPATIVVKEAKTLRYVLVNRAGEAYFGAQRESMIGKTSEQVFSPETAELIAEHDRELLRTGKAQFYDEHPTTTPGAGPRIVTTARMPIRDEQGDVQYLLTVIEDRTNRKRAEAQIAHMVHHDPLTGLPNRTAFNECLSATIETAAKDGTSFALMSLDIDRFKETNDVFGHVVGDDLLCEIARRLQKAVGGAFVARLGGDEFTIISTDGEQPAAAETLAQQIIAAIAEETKIDGHHLRSAISIGISIFPANAEDAELLMANADAALYRAKSEGRGIHRFFEAAMDERLRERRALQHDLQSAIERNELTLNYQPQARIDGEKFGFEALVRWRHPTRGMISPGKFIPLAEESGLIVPLGEWILREACREAASWARPLQIAINLSPVQFRHGDLAALVHSVLIETGLSPARLELEITEGVLIGDFARALSMLRRLKTLGVRIAMDDFGTGYSSLSYLQAFPFDKIKIDQAFISNLETNPQSATIVRAVIGLARGLNVPVLAEGVETREQLAFLAKEQCDEVQGYLIGRPLPIADYAEMTGAPISLSARKTRAALAG